MDSIYYYLGWTAAPTNSTQQQLSLPIDLHKAISTQLKQLKPTKSNEPTFPRHEIRIDPLKDQRAMYLIKKHLGNCP